MQVGWTEVDFGVVKRSSGRWNRLMGRRSVAKGGANDGQQPIGGASRRASFDASDKWSSQSRGICLQPLPTPRRIQTNRMNTWTYDSTDSDSFVTRDEDSSDQSKNDKQWTSYYRPHPIYLPSDSITNDIFDDQQSSELNRIAVITDISITFVGLFYAGLYFRYTIKIIA